jgi:GNAT superfamily N-acetyltransferase
LRFQSGDEALDLFFHRYAGQNQFRAHIGITYEAIEGGHILGFVTVSQRHIGIEDLPERTRKKLPRYPVPVLGLARLTVDKHARSRGLGAQLLRFVFKLAAKMAEEVACAGAVVDAKPGAIEFYAKYGFISFEPLEGKS